MRNLRNRNSGITLMAAILAMAIVSIAGTVMFWILTQSNFQGFRLERKLKGGRALARFALQIQSLSPEGVRALCQSPDRFSSPFTSPCPSADGRSIVGVAPPDRSSPNSLPLPLNEALDWNGDPLSADAPTSSRKLCISVLKCTDLADHQIMEIELIGYWITPGENSLLTEQRLNFRKSR